MDEMDIDDRNLNSNLSLYRPEEIEILRQYYGLLQEHFESPNVLLHNFIRVIRTQEVTKLVSMWEVFQKILPIHGSIIEVGVLDGFNIFALAHFSEILEHRNYTRTIYGFDTFSGYPPRNPDKDKANADPNMFKSTYSLGLLEKCVELFNSSTVFSQFSKISLIQGDATATIPTFVEEHPELEVAMLLCQTDTYGPTKAALKYFYPKMPKGGVVLFVSLNFPETPGELLALQEEIGISTVRLQRLPYATKLSYFVKE